MIQTALCSFGMSGYLFHAPFLDTHPGFNFYAVLERSKNQAAEKYPGVITYRTLKDLLADPSIDLVIVNTPSITHYAIAKQVIEAGKHLVVEKPFTATVAEAEELITLAAEKGVILSVYHNRRFDSDFLTAKRILSEGWLGEIVDAEIHYDRFVPELSYKLHKETPKGPVGSLYDLGSHIIDQALQLFGLPQALFADMALLRPGSMVTDYFDLKLIYSNHRVALKSNYFVREALPAYVFHGKKGSFLKSKADVQEADLLAWKKPDALGWGVEPERERGLLHTEKEGVVIREMVETEKGNYMHFYNGLYEALMQGKPVPVSGEEGLQVISVIEAALKSYAEKRIVAL